MNSRTRIEALEEALDEVVSSWEVPSHLKETAEEALEYYPRCRKCKAPTESTIDGLCEDCQVALEDWKR